MKTIIWINSDALLQCEAAAHQRVKPKTIKIPPALT